MPEISITRPAPAWNLMVKTLGIPMAVLLLVGIVFGMKSGNSGIIIGAILVPFLYCGGFLGQIWTVGRDQARKSQELVASSSPGTLYAGMATPITPQGPGAPGSRFRSTRDQGVLRLSAAGVSFYPNSPNGAGPELYPWNRLARVILTSRASTAGSFEVQTVEGMSRRWQVTSLTQLIEVLDQLSTGGLATPPSKPF